MLSRLSPNLPYNYIRFCTTIAADICHLMRPQHKHVRLWNYLWIYRPFIASRQVPSEDLAVPSQLLLQLKSEPKNVNLLSDRVLHTPTHTRTGTFYTKNTYNVTYNPTGLTLAILIQHCVCRNPIYFLPYSQDVTPQVPLCNVKSVVKKNQQSKRRVTVRVYTIYLFDETRE